MNRHIFGITSLLFAVILTVSTQQELSAAHEAIVVDFQNAEGNRLDWVGLYETGGTVLLDWFYTYGTQSGSAGVINGSVTFHNGLVLEGNYEVRLHFNNSFVIESISDPFYVSSGF